MSWNYMQPNAGLLQYAGAGMNNLGKGLLGMSQQVQEMPYHQKRLGLLDAERNKTHYQGLLYRHQAENQNIRNQSQYQIDQSNIANTYAQMRLTDAKAQGQNAQNYQQNYLNQHRLPQSVMYANQQDAANLQGTHLQNAGQVQKNRILQSEADYAPLNNEQALRAKEEAIRAQQFAQNNAEHEHNINQLARMLGYYPSKELRAKIMANPENGMQYLMEEARSHGGYNFTPNFLEPITEGLLGEEERRKRIENSPFWKGIRGGNQ